MPEICRFYGIIIRMYFVDHAPPHYHVFYGADEAVVDIRTTGILAGHLPPKASALVSEWSNLHQAEILQAWEKASASMDPGSIAPLQ
jgi:hypothetical protein